MDVHTKVLLVTANVGSLFEDPEGLLQTWLHEFLSKVSYIQPKFLALHLQEVGGKTYEKSMEHVQEFIRCLCDDSVMAAYLSVHAYLDEDFKSAEHFTALGNLYFAHIDIVSLKIWNFLTHNWEEQIQKDKHIYCGNIETIATKEKSKFPQNYFPECKWSRKGFMRTRWEINGTVIDLVNIHLFHDASNLVACESFPSVYCKTRRRALVHTIERFHSDEKNGSVPYFLFGDFNFRCDTDGVVKELTKNLNRYRAEDTRIENNKVHYRNSIGDTVLTIGKKEFSHVDHQLKFKEDWLKKYDRELEPLKDTLDEYPINFFPTYPFEEDPHMPMDYMSTRCPAWCDRILMSPQIKEMVVIDEWKYGMIGESACMGDHKPIYLSVRLKANKGTCRSCVCTYTQTYAKSENFPTSPLPAVRNICPYSNKLFLEILCECKNIPSSAKLTNVTDVRNVFESLKVSQSEHKEGITPSNIPNITINVIDSDNVCLCLCAQLPSTILQFDDQMEKTDELNCVMCRNIGKIQTTAYQHKLFSERLLLPQDTIISTIDHQHLNTDIEHVHDDPYTPESNESHSPHPEMTSISNQIRNPFDPTLSQDRYFEIKNTELDPSDSEKLAISRNFDSEKQPRGTVPPDQLKSRLENLQKLSIRSLGRDDHFVRNGDVENVNNVCSSACPSRTRRNSIVIPMCCNIN
ncbi:inositol polyphosphate-5-phosphatase A isoform X1 [Drosophila miranda]|uniref:inositol polyphosphate-5-phosphatase A isoform X1 n=1 Tax=Drosophila miranda TaxID=7229 RepID=UPI0007E88B31|nr:inositol polyphosphate-5-phosphatase A isoform X1 [Drosophila miranda]